MHSLIRVVKNSKVVKRDSFKKGCLYRNSEHSCLGSFRRSFVQASVRSWVPRTPPPAARTPPPRHPDKTKTFAIVVSLLIHKLLN